MLISYEEVVALDSTAPDVGESFVDWVIIKLCGDEGAFERIGVGTGIQFYQSDCPIATMGQIRVHRFLGVLFESHNGAGSRFA